MPTIIIIALLIWAISSIAKSASAKKAERNRQAQIARINAENMKRRAEAQRMREEFRQRQLEAKLEVERMVAIEREQMRLRKFEQEQLAWNVKQEALNEKMISRIERCEDTIAHHSEMFEVYSARLGKAENDLEEVSDKLLVLTITLEKASVSDKPIPARQIEEMNRDVQKLTRQKEQLEDKVIKLKNQKFSAEQKIKKAEADKAEAERKIA